LTREFLPAVVVSGRRRFTSVNGGKEVMTMMSISTSTDIIVMDVEAIEVVPIENHEKGVMRVVVIRSKDNEIYRLLLHGEFAIDLRLCRDEEDRNNDWLRPNFVTGEDLDE
jgi:hypothetical protein